MNDLRFAFRQLLKHPGFSAVAVLTLALGIGANTAVFSLFNELSLRTLRVKNAKELMGVVLIGPHGDFANQRIPFPICRDYREQTRSFAELLAYASASTTIQIGNDTRREPIQLVSFNFFQGLGAIPVLGRTFTADDDRAPTQAPPIVLSHRCWQEWFAGDSNILGQTITLRPSYVPPLTATIVGVVPAAFTGLEARAPAFWITSVMEEHFRREQSVNFRMAGFLAPEVTHSQATAELDVITGNIAAKYGGAVIPGYGNEGVFRSDVRTELRPAARGAWGAFKPHRELQRGTFLASAVGALMLLVACANLSNLQLARATQRRREMAIRLSIGASRGQLFRQLLIESLVLAVLGGGAGILVARWTNQLLFAIKPADLAFVVPTSLDLRVVGFALSLGVLAGIIFGTAPAWKAACADLNTGLKNDVGVDGIRRGWALRDLLVVGQLAICLLLLISAGLCLRNLTELQLSNPGFNTRETLILPLHLKGYSKAGVGSFFDAVAQQLETLPGIRQVTFAESLPLLGGGGASVPAKQIEAYTPQKDEFINLEFTRVGPRFFETLGIPIVQSPQFELRGNAARFWINESFARRYWPGLAPMGKRMGPFVVNGIVRDCQIKNLTDAPTPHIYWETLRPEATSLVLLFRTDGNTPAAIGAVRQRLSRLDANLDLSRLQTMRQLLSASLAKERFLVLVLGSLAFGALMLGALGIYGVMSHLVSLRTREIGVRMALGAQRHSVLGLILGHGTRLIVLGMVMGIAGSLASTQVLRSVLHNVSPVDPLTFGAVAALLAGVALLACWLPAQRATNIDPMEALRHE